MYVGHSSLQMLRAPRRLAAETNAGAGAELYRKVEGGMRCTGTSILLFECYTVFFKAYFFFFVSKNKRFVSMMSNSEEDVLGKLAYLLENNMSVDMQELAPIFQYWLTKVDRAQKADSKLELNDMHVIGAVLSVLLYRSTFEPCTLQTLLRSTSAQITITDKPLCEYGWEDLCNICLSLQLEFSNLYTKVADGYDSNVDVELLCLNLMHRAGFWFSHRFYNIDTNSTTNQSKQVDHVPSEALRGLVDIHNDGFCTVRVDSMRHFLNAIHSMLALNLILDKAEVIEAADEMPEVLNHHLEASAEYFFTLSMTADCKVGTIAQYAHKFSHLFHSISQVIYFNVPTYARQKQLKLSELQKINAPHINMLPPLLELYPTVPVFYEHTGAGLCSVHDKHEFAWVVWDKFVFLITNSQRVLISDDLRTLTTLF